MILTQSSELTAEKWEECKKTWWRRPKAAATMFLFIRLTFRQSILKTDPEYVQKTIFFSFFLFFEKCQIFWKCQKWMKNEVFSGGATQDLIEHVVLIICGADICLEDACIPFSKPF